MSWPSETTLAKLGIQMALVYRLPESWTWKADSKWLHYHKYVTTSNMRWLSIKYIKIYSKLDITTQTVLKNKFHNIKKKASMIFTEIVRRKSLRPIGRFFGHAVSRLAFDCACATGSKRNVPPSELGIPSDLGPGYDPGLEGGALWEAICRSGRRRRVAVAGATIVQTRGLKEELSPANLHEFILHRDAIVDLDPAAAGCTSSDVIALLSLGKCKKIN